MACSKDSDEEYSGGGTMASSAKFLVSSTIPEDHATGVSLFTSVVIGFNNDVNSSSVSGNNFSLSSNGIAVPAKLSNSKNVVVLLPSSSLSNATLYSASVSTTVQDISGNSLDQESSWKFTTVSASSDNSSGVIQVPVEIQLQIPPNQVLFQSVRLKTPAVLLLTLQSL